MHHHEAFVINTFLTYTAHVKSITVYMRAYINSHVRCVQRVNKHYWRRPRALATLYHLLLQHSINDTLHFISSVERQSSR